MRFLKPISDCIMTDLISRVTTLESKHKECEIQHQNHNRRHDDHAKNNEKQTQILEQILETLKEHAPVFKRARDDQTTRDKIKEYAIWIAAVAAGGGGVHYWLTLFSGG